MLSFGLRLGNHWAPGPGRHQGAAVAALISPKSATTFSNHAQSKEERKSKVWRQRKKRKVGYLEEEKHEEEEEQKDEEENPTSTTSLLPPRPQLPAPTAVQQLRAAFYSCTFAGNTNQYKSADTAHHIPFIPWNLNLVLNSLITP